MKKFTFLVLACLFISIGAYAQLELPAPSPAAMVSQEFGMTKATIMYSSPGVKDRKIFGDLVPYDKLWRTGANKATSIEFSTNVMIEGEEVEAGKYSIFTIPGKSSWTLILNKETELWGTGGYSEDMDVVRVKVQPKEVPMRERMIFYFADFNNENANIVMEWEKTQVAFTVEFATDEMAMTTIQNEMNAMPGTMANAARYTLRAGNHQDKGLEWIDQAIAMNETWYYYWIKAELLHAKKENKEAYKNMEKAKELGDKSDRFFYKDDVEKALAEWPKK